MVDLEESATMYQDRPIGFVSAVNFSQVSLLRAAKGPEGRAQSFYYFDCGRDLKPRLILAEALVWRSTAKSAKILSGSAKTAGCQVCKGRDLRFCLFGRSTAQISSLRHDVLRAVRSTRTDQRSTAQVRSRREMRGR